MFIQSFVGLLITFRRINGIMAIVRRMMNRMNRILYMKQILTLKKNKRSHCFPESSNYDGWLGFALLGVAEQWAPHTFDYSKLTFCYIILNFRNYNRNMNV